MYTKPMYLNETWACNYGILAPVEPDLLGLEIELEGKKVTSIPTNDAEFNGFWEAVPDGSLKVMNPGDQAIEYRFRQPLNLDDTDKALKLLQTNLTKPGVVVYESGRTSVHVHVNCSSEKLVHVYNYLTLSAIFDELLVSQNGPTRIGNNFCLRAIDAEGLMVGMSDSIALYGNLKGLSQSNRYSSINPLSLFKFGTIEFRSMECTIDRARLLNWCKTLLAIKKAAKTFTNPLEIVSAFSLLGPERFFLNILGPQAITYMKVMDRHRMLFNGMRLVQEFVNSATWEAFKAGAAPKPKPKAPKLKPFVSFDQYYTNLIQQANQADQIAPSAGSAYDQWTTQPVPPVSAPEPVAEEDDDDDHDFDLPDFDDVNEDF